MARLVRLAPEHPEACTSLGQGFYDPWKMSVTPFPVGHPGLCGAGAGPQRGNAFVDRAACVQVDGERHSGKVNAMSPTRISLTPCVHPRYDDALALLDRSLNLRPGDSDLFYKCAASNPQGARRFIPGLLHAGEG